MHCKSKRALSVAMLEVLMLPYRPGVIGGHARRPHLREERIHDDASCALSNATPG